MNDDVKALRKKDPVAAAKLHKHLKRKQRKAKRIAQNDIQQTKFGVQGLIDGPTIEDQGNQGAQSGQSGQSGVDIIPGAEYVAPTVDQQVDEVQRMLRLARGLPATPEPSDAGSSTESEAEEETAVLEFSEVFRRHQMLGQRAAKRLLEAEERRFEPRGAAEEVQPGETEGEPPRKAPALSKKKLRELSRPPVAELKMACARPDVVEVWDATAPDPHTLVWLKAYRNTVKVPCHWNQKRKYLSGKRAIEKAPFRLPEYIEQTKISEIRAAILERESQKSLKQKQRDKVRPKSNRMHVDFRTLHDAFFKYATKSELTPFGELYFEGKEREEKTRQFKPGQLSSKLKEALSLVLATTPPPWLLTMQRYGPPPSYPNLKIPGLNAPLPVGAQWGFHAGGWGKPPSDQFGNPLYPEVFAEPTPLPQPDAEDLGPPVYWGEIIEGNLDSDEEEEEPVEEAELVEEEPQAPPPELVVPAVVPVPAAPAPVPAPAPAVPAVPAVPSIGVPYQRLEPAPAPVQPATIFPSTQTYIMPTQQAAGLLTPLAGILTPSHVLATPAALVSATAMPPSDFSPENIKQQLKSHEEADKKAKEAIAAAEADEQRRRADEKKKKKKQFKF